VPGFRHGESISGYQPTDGNAAQLMADSNTAIDIMMADNDSAIDQVHSIFFIWLPKKGSKIVEALQRAASRGGVWVLADAYVALLFDRGTRGPRLAGQAPPLE
jgi:phosphatidylserine/phosphatidylglycerophosphate/cardiolipin synthase-like enzyme